MDDNRNNAFILVGVGLIGGSLALATKQAGAARTVVGVGRSEASRAVAQARGLADRVTDDLASGVRGADLVVLAVPVPSVSLATFRVSSTGGAGSGSGD